MPLTLDGLCCFNTLRPRRNGRHFADAIFKVIFLNENVWIPIKISLKFVLWGPINNIPAFVQIMAWRRPDDKPLSGPMMVRLPTHICVIRPQWVKEVKNIYFISLLHTENGHDPGIISYEWHRQTCFARLLKPDLTIGHPKGIKSHETYLVGPKCHGLSVYMRLRVCVCSLKLESTRWATSMVTVNENVRKQPSSSFQWRSCGRFNARLQYPHF